MNRLLIITENMIIINIKIPDSQIKKSTISEN